jgi:hypothetical protein
MTVQQQITAALMPFYGASEAARVAMVIVPSFFTDFRKEILKAKPGVTVSEEYGTEDRKVVISLAGEHLVSGGQSSAIVRSIRVSDRQIELPDVYGIAKGFKL